MAELQQLLDFPDDQLADQWQSLERWLHARFDRDPTIESILFLIGVHSRGIGYSPKMEKEEKQDLIMEGTCLAFETLGHYQRVGMEPDGRWVWERSVDLPELSIEEQEKLLRIGITRYFEQFVETEGDS